MSYQWIMNDLVNLLETLRRLENERLISTGQSGYGLDAQGRGGTLEDQPRSNLEGRRHFGPPF